MTARRSRDTPRRGKAKRPGWVPLTTSRVRIALLAIFTLGLVCQIVAFVTIRQRMWQDELDGLILKLVALYSVHFGVILGGVFAQAGDHDQEVSPFLGWTAMGLAVLWNLLLGWRSVAFALASADSVQDLTRYLEAVSVRSSYLVAGALAFFFTKSAEREAPPEETPPADGVSYEGEAKGRKPVRDSQHPGRA
jgi:FtsH-binding integral membrane protein